MRWTTKSLLMVLVSLACLSMGMTLAWHHPLSPLLCLVALWLWVCWVLWQPSVWLWAVPACMPVLNFSPWSGWLVFEEFDLLLLGSLAGAYAHLAWQTRVTSLNHKRSHSKWDLWLAVVALSGLWALWRGLEDAGGFHFDWFAGYSDALNSWRVFKSLGFALLFVPLLRWQVQRDSRAMQTRLALGMVLGLTLVTLATLWERAVFPGVFDFSAHYRTVALFWEMHVGGAAIDAYLAISTPFVVWALMATRRPIAWFFLALLSVLTAYVALTTFSRGVYLAVLAPLFLLAVLLLFQKHATRGQRVLARVFQFGDSLGWRAKASWLLSLALALEVLAVLEGGTFMSKRLASAGQDFSSRLVHWQNGLDLLTNPADWLLGKGLGRIPANYAAQVPDGEFPGAIRQGFEDIPGEKRNVFLTLYGPKSMSELGGSFALTQRVNSTAPKLHRAYLDVRVAQETLIDIYLCERHLLYDRSCQAAFLRVKPVTILGQPQWQSFKVTLKGNRFAPPAWYAPRLMMFSVSVLNAGGLADIDNLALSSQNEAGLLANGDFHNGLAHWFPASQSYFEPWHLDNLFLEVLVERGLLGLFTMGLLLAGTLWHLIWGRGRQNPLAPFLAASLVAVLLVGLVSSVMDVPRVAFLFWLLLFGAMETTQTDSEVRVQRSDLGHF